MSEEPPPEAEEEAPLVISEETDGVAEESREARDNPRWVEARQLRTELEENPYRFDFYQAARRLECVNPHLPPIGESRSPREDSVRFGQFPSLDFAPSTLQAFNYIEEDRFGDARDSPVPKLHVRHFGLTGPNGPLPLTFTEFVLNRLNATPHPDAPDYSANVAAGTAGVRSDPTLAAFIDLFNHRLTALFYRAWANSRKTTDYDRPDRARFSTYFGSLAGTGMESLKDRTEVPDEARHFFSGHLSNQNRHAEGLASVISDYFGVPVQIIEFVGHWLPLPEENHCLMGKSEETGLLGESIIMGTRYWDCQLRFKIRLGPMPLEDYERFLPGSDSLRDLKTLVLHYIGEEYFVDVQPVLRKEDVPDTQLGIGGRLGHTSWMRTKPHRRIPPGKTVFTECPPFPKDADDLVTQI